MNKPLSSKKNASDTEKEFYLVEEVAKKLRISNMTVYRYIKAGKIQAHKIGKEFRIKKETFEGFIKKSSTR